MRYTNDEIEKLKEMWPTARTKAEIKEAFPGRSEAALGLKAQALGLKAFPRHRRANLEALLDDTLENWYWYGFILADGYFSSRGELSITLDGKDKSHLQLLADHIGVQITHLKPSATAKGVVRKHIRIAAMNKEVISELQTKLGLISARKTENPPLVEILKTISDDKLEALFVGFFDGDGCMRAKGYGQIICHASWLPIFEYFQEKNLVKNAAYDSSGRAYCVLPVAVASRLKLIPINKLNRKWSNVK